MQGEGNELLDAHLVGDVSSVYTSEVLQGANALMLPASRKQRRNKPEVVKKGVGKRTQRALLKLKEKQRIKRLTATVNRESAELPKTDTDAVRLLSLLMNTKLSNERFAVVYSELLKHPSVRMPEQIQKRAEKLKKILKAKALSEEEEAQD